MHIHGLPCEVLELSALLSIYGFHELESGMTLYRITYTWELVWSGDELEVTQIVSFLCCPV